MFLGELTGVLKPVSNKYSFASEKNIFDNFHFVHVNLFWELDTVLGDFLTDFKTWTF